MALCSFLTTSLDDLTTQDLCSSKQHHYTKTRRTPTRTAPASVQRLVFVSSLSTTRLVCLRIPSKPHQTLKTSPPPPPPPPQHHGSRHRQARHGRTLRPAVHQGPRGGGRNGRQGSPSGALASTRPRPRLPSSASSNLDRASSSSRSSPSSSSRSCRASSTTTIPGCVAAAPDQLGPVLRPCQGQAWCAQVRYAKYPTISWSIANGNSRTSTGETDGAFGQSVSRS